jgi:D-alanyl-D-alanine carboxypeptidase/D-alanyl-D-alanine-endopeptidase (penicillin-binding protein 4)
MSLLADPAVSRAHWGVAVTTLNGVPIWGLDEGKLFRPASNAKLYTTVAALSLIDPKRTLHTAVWGNAPDASGVVTGGLTLVGGGDPSFSTDDIPYRTPADRKAAGLPITPPDPLQGLDDLAAQVAAHGVKHVFGGIVGSDALWVWEPYPDTWGVDDLTTDDGAPVSALTVNDNTVVLKVLPGAKPGDAAAATLSPLWSGYTLALDVKTVAAGTPASIGIDRAVGSKLVRVFGTVAIGAPRTRSLAIDDPAQFAAAAFRDRLIQHGVTVEAAAEVRHRLSTDTKGFTVESHEPMTQAGLHSLNEPFDVPSCDQAMKLGETPKTCTLFVKLADHASALLADEVVLTMKVSENLHAEMLLRELGQEHGAPTVPMVSEPSTTAQGARVVRQFLLNAGLDGDDFLFYDGSGLSSHDLVTPRTTAQLLSFATTQPWFTTWKASMPVGGVDGTLSGRFKDAPLKGHVFAKTGTLGESRGLSGYLDCASGKQVIFSIFVDGHTPIGSADRSVMDKIVAAIASND